MTRSEQDSTLEELLRRCISALETEGRDSLNRILAAHPDQAVAVRKKMENLSDLGLLRPSLERTLRPEQIGPYRILEELGEGGMGRVFLADQKEPGECRVALKVIKVGMDTRQVMKRFEAERNALALMDHKNISRVFDAGATEQGWPYFAMEYVPGVPITRYCDEKRLTVEERLRLFLPVCEAVQHAHFKGIIHRDLKPTNVLVMEQDGKPVPKIIDFGVAKATNKRLTEETLCTEQGMILGTPEYMSPEQAGRDGQDVDTRTDVYSLGVMMYELLTGSLPFESRELRQAGYEEMQRIIREEEPETPSTRVTTRGKDAARMAGTRKTDSRTLVRRLRGDLDWITLRALEKDRTRRYETPLDLAADIRRHLNHEPVSAGSPSRLYRLGKFLRKHRDAVLVTALVGIALAVGLVSTVVVYLRGEDNRKEAELAAKLERERRLAEARQADHWDRINTRMDAWLSAVAHDRDMTMCSYFEHAARSMDDEAFEPEVEADFHRRFGNFFTMIQKFGKADKHLRKALDLYRRKLGRTHPKTVSSLLCLTRSLCERGRYVEAEGMIRSALEENEENPDAAGREAPRTLRLLEWLGVSLYGQGKGEEARKLLEQVLQENPAYHEPSSLDAVAQRAQLYILLGRYDEAMKDLDCSMKLAPRYYEAYFKRGIIYFVRGDPVRAEAEFKKFFQKTKRAEAYVWLFKIHMDQGPDWKAARNALERALEINPELPQVHMNLGRLFHEEGLAAVVEDAGEIFARSAAFFAEAIRITGRQVEAERFLETTGRLAARCFMRGEGPESPLGYALRGLVYWKKGALEEAAEDLDRGVLALGSDAELGDRTRIEHYLHKHAMLFLAKLAGCLGRGERSLLLFRRVLKNLDPENPRALEMAGPPSR